MTLELRHFRGLGDIKQERVVLFAKDELDVGQYVLNRTLRVGDAIYPTIFNSFWFPDLAVRKGDFVVLYTKAGTPSFKKNDNGRTTHFYYWEQTETIWGEDEAAILMRIADWQSLIPDSDDL